MPTTANRRPDPRPRLAAALVAIALGQAPAARAQGPAADAGMPLTLVPEATAFDAPPELTGAAPVADCGCGERRGLLGRRRHKAACRRHLQEHLLGYPEEFEEAPLGASLYAHGRTQVGNAAAARLTFYDFDFVADSDQLNARGRQKLARTAAELPRLYAPVVIEPIERAPGLAESRRQAVLAGLNAPGGFPVPAERVIVAAPMPTGLRGPEAIVGYGRQLNHVSSGGAIGGGGGTSDAFNGGFTSGGLSAPAVTPGFGTRP